MINRKLSKTLCRLSSILVCMALVLLTVPTVSLPVSAATSGKTEGGTWRRQGDTLIFSGSGSMKPVWPQSPQSPSLSDFKDLLQWRDEYRKWKNKYRWGDNIKEIIIEDGITFICDSAFAYNENLTHITIPPTVTSIGKEAFSNCSSLPSLSIPSTVETIGPGAFQHCEALVTIALPDNITIIESSTFDGCSSLSAFTIPSKVTTIGQGAFYDCSSLASLTLPDGIKTIEPNTFKNCSALTELHIPNNVMTIGESAFDGCAKLTTLQIPASVKRIDKSAFSYCSALESLTVDANNLTFHSDGNCIIHTTNTVLIAGCANSQIPSDGSVTAIGDAAFLGQSGLSTITIPQTITSIGKEAFRKTGISSVTLPKSVTKIDEKAFADCEFLSSVAIPDTVTSIAKDAFEGCDNITIRGKFGSYAETFATENDFIFVEAKDSEFIIPGENANNWVWYLLLPIGSIVLVVVGVFVGFFLGKRKRPTVITETLPATEPRTDESAISQQ